MRPVSACAIAVACCLIILPTIDPVAAAPQVRGRGHVFHGHGFVPAHLTARRAVHRGFHRHARFHRFHRHHGFAGGWPGYVDWGYAPFASGFVEGAEAPAADVFPSVAQVPVVVGIREGPVAQPAIIVVGRNRVRVRGSKAQGARSAQYAASGPLIIKVPLSRR